LATVIAYMLWNLLWPVALIAIAVVAVSRYRRWAARSQLHPQTRRRIFIGLMAIAVVYAILRPEVPVRLAQYIWPPNMLARAQYDLIGMGQRASLEDLAYVSRLTFPDSTRLRAADDHSWLEGETRGRVTMGTADVPALIASRPDLEPADPSDPLLYTAQGRDPLWWAPRPPSADAVWRAAGLQVTVHAGWFGRSTVFVDATGL